MIGRQYQYKASDTRINVNYKKVMFVNKRYYFTGLFTERDHKIKDTISRVGDILKDLELFPQCRWIRNCDIKCCMYQCHKCYVNATMVGVLQDCFIKLKQISTRENE